MRYKGELGLFIVAIIWGMGFVVTKIGLDYVTPYQQMAIRFSIGAILLSLAFFKKIPTISKQALIHGGILGTILYISFAFQTVGIQFTTPSKNAFLTATNVVIVPFIGYLLFKRKLDRYGVLGAFIAIIGIGILSIQDNLSMSIGDSLTIICAVGYAFHIFLTGEFLSRGTDALHLTVVQIITACACSLLFLMFQSDSQPLSSIGLKGWLAAIYLGIFATTIAFLLQTLSQKHTSETKAAIILVTESVFGTIFSILILHEQLTLRMFLGCALILAAVIIAETKPGMTKNPTHT